MANPLIMKLANGAELTDADRARLAELSQPTRKVDARVDVIREYDVPTDVHLVMSGMACRYKLLADGRRSIMAYLVPGDFCDLHVAILGAMDHGIATLSRCALVEIPRDTVETLLFDHPRIARAMWWATLVDEATLREWLVNVGRRRAEQRLAHLFCELFWRLRTVGLADGGAFELPLTQDELADTLGISAVHVNRVLQQLREQGLITLQSRALTIPDHERLQEFAGFDPNYLHLRHRQVGDEASRDWQT